MRGGRSSGPETTRTQEKARRFPVINGIRIGNLERKLASLKKEQADEEAKKSPPPAAPVVAAAPTRTHGLPMGQVVAPAAAPALPMGSVVAVVTPDDVEDAAPK